MISLCGQAEVQSQLDGMTRNRHIYEQIARDLDDLVWAGLLSSPPVDIPSPPVPSMIPALLGVADQQKQWERR